MLTSPVHTVKRAAKNALPNDLVHLLRKRFGTPRPWDPSVTLPPPQPAPGERTGPPDFVGVGTQKSGTSWWYAVIATHPNVHDVAGAHKERHFFSRYYGVEWGGTDVEAYHRWFPRPEGKLVGEWTPQYMYLPWAPPLLALAAPNAKLLVLLRDPVERYRSGLTHYMARDWDLDDRLAIEAVNRGFYADQLERLYRSFPREQVLVLQYEACRVDPIGQAGRTLEFLGLDVDVATPGLESQPNTTRIPKVAVPDHLRTTLVELYRPDIDRLVELVPDLDLDLWPNFEAGR